MPKLERPTYLMAKIFVRNHDLIAESCSTAGPVEVTCVSAGNIGGVFAAGNVLEGFGGSQLNLCSVHAYPFD